MSSYALPVLVHGPAYSKRLVVEVHTLKTIYSIDKNMSILNTTTRAKRVSFVYRVQNELCRKIL